MSSESEQELLRQLGTYARAEQQVADRGELNAAARERIAVAIERALRTRSSTPEHWYSRHTSRGTRGALALGLLAAAAGAMLWIVGPRSAATLPNYELRVVNPWTDYRAGDTPASDRSPVLRGGALSTLTLQPAETHDSALDVQVWLSNDSRRVRLPIQFEHDPRGAVQIQVELPNQDAELEVVLGEPGRLPAGSGSRGAGWQRWRLSVRHQLTD